MSIRICSGGFKLRARPRPNLGCIPCVLVGKKRFAAGHLVCHPCIFIYIVGSSFIFNIFFVPAPRPSSAQA